jgi:hypothetical protein
MVAYSFKSRFAEPILEGTKRQTIRAIGKRRHAKPGERLQLYVGMRTRQCRKIMDAACKEVLPVRLVFSKHSAAELFQVGNVPLGPKAMEAFARLDGFASVDEMAAFWFAEHGDGRPLLGFEGVCVRW